MKDKRFYNSTFKYWVGLTSKDKKLVERLSIDPEDYKQMSEQEKLDAMLKGGLNAKEILEFWGYRLLTDNSHHLEYERRYDNSRDIIHFDRTSSRVYVYNEKYDRETRMYNPREREVRGVSYELMQVLSKQISEIKEDDMVTPYIHYYQKKYGIYSNPRNKA